MQLTGQQTGNQQGGSPVVRGGAETDRNARGLVRVLITGERGAGKTSVCERAVEVLKKRGLRCGGVLTRKLVDTSGSIEGLQVIDLLTEPLEERLLARTDGKTDGPWMGPYRFACEGLRFGREAIERAAADVVFADELGYLELRGQGFSNLFARILSSYSPPMVVVVRTALLEEVMKRIQEVGPAVLEVNPSNRDRLHEKVVQCVAP